MRAFITLVCIPILTACALAGCATTPPKTTAAPAATVVDAPVPVPVSELVGDGYDGDEVCATPDPEVDEEG